MSQSITKTEIQKKIKVNDSLGSERIDKYLVAQLATFSRHQIRKAIEKGDILVNQKKIKPSYHLKNDDLIIIRLKKDETSSQLQPLLPPLSLEPQIIYEDQDLLAINKPAGLIVHPTFSRLREPSVASWFLTKYPEVKSVGENSLRPGIIHRLDKDTSGILLLAKTQLAFRYFKELFIKHQITKEYLALVRGEIKARTGVIAFPLARSRTFGKRKVITSQKEKNSAKSALTFYEVLECFQGYTLLKVIPKTGRTHQIRVHLASFGFPVAGDRIYGKITPPEKQRFPRQMLHAQRISFLHLNGEELSLEAPLPQDFELVLKQLTIREKMC